MPSPFPRVSVVLPPDDYDLLLELSQLEGRSVASYVRRLVELARPSLLKVVEPLKRAEIERRLLDDNLQVALDELLSEAEDELAEQIDLEDFLSSRTKGKRGGKRGAEAKPPAHVGAPLNPRILTGGSSPSPDGGANIVPIKRKAR